MDIVWLPTWSPLMLTITCVVTLVFLWSVAAFANRRNVFPLVGHSTPVVVVSMFALYVDAITLLLQGLTNSSVPCEFVLIFNLIALLLASNCYLMRAWRIWFRYNTAAARLKAQKSHVENFLRMESHKIVPTSSFDTHVPVCAFNKPGSCFVTESCASQGAATTTTIPGTASRHSPSEEFQVVLSKNEREISPKQEKTASAPVAPDAPEFAQNRYMERRRRRSTGDASLPQSTSTINIPSRARTSLAPRMSGVLMVQPAPKRGSDSSVVSSLAIDIPAESVAIAATTARASLSVVERVSKRSSNASHVSSLTHAHSLDIPVAFIDHDTRHLTSRASISVPSRVGSDVTVSAQGSVWDTAYDEKYCSRVPSLMGRDIAAEVPDDLDRDWFVKNARFFTSRSLLMAVIAVTLLESIAPIALYVAADKSGDLPGAVCPSLQVPKFIVQANIGLYVFLVIWTVHKLRDVNDAYGIKDQLRYCVFWAIWGLTFGVTQNLVNRNLYICLFVVMSLGLICQTLVSPVISSYRGNIFRSSQRSLQSSRLDEHELHGAAPNTKRALTVTQLNINLEGDARNFEPATLASNTIKTLTLQRDASHSQINSKSHQSSRRNTLSKMYYFFRNLLKESSRKSPNDRRFETQLKQLRLIDVFRDVEMLELFLEHIKREFSVENYLFYCVATEFQRLCEQKKLKSTEERNSRAAEIYCKFIDVDSDLQVNLDCDTSQKILTDLRVAIPEFSTPTFLARGIPPLVKPLLTRVKSTIFRKACRASFHLMERDSFTRFKRSHLMRKSAGVLSRTSTRAHTRKNSLDASSIASGQHTQSSNDLQGFLDATEYPVVYTESLPELSRSISLSSSSGVSAVP